jgi:ligand-binding sensor domain-containing protein
MSQIPSLDVVSSLVVRQNHEIWVGTNQEIYKYQTDTREWKSYTSIDNEHVIPTHLYLAADGTLWGTGLRHLVQDSRNRALPLLSKYNENADQFEFVKDQDGLLQENNSTRLTSNIREDTKGSLWLIQHFFEEGIGTRSALYSIDVGSIKVKQYLVASPENPEFVNFAFDPDGKIWIIEFGAEGTQLVQYDSISGKATPYSGRLPDNGIPQDNLVRDPDFNNIRNLYLDRAGRLWVDDIGWLDFTDKNNPMWYKIIRSSVFLTDSSRPESQYGWTRPYLTYQSSNGQYWFSSQVGIVRLNPEKAEWCLFTTGNSPVVEDKNSNLWIAVFGKLYKYQLEQ